MSEVQHLNTKYRLTEVDSGTKVFETTLEGDIGNVTIPTEKLRPDTKYKLDATYTTDNAALNNLANDGLLASVTFQTKGNDKLPPVGSNGKVDWNRHVLNGTTLYEAVGGMEKLQSAGIKEEDYEIMISRLMKSVEVVFRQKEPDNAEFPLKSDDKQNIIVMPVTIKTTRVIDGATGRDISGIFDGKFEWDESKPTPEAPKEEPNITGEVPPAQPFTPSPDTPLSELDSETRRLMKWWSIQKPNIAENNAGITNIVGHNGLLEIASFVKTDRYPGNHDATEWQWSYEETMENPQETTKDPKYRTHFNPNVKKSNVWVYVRYRFVSNYAPRALNSPWSDIIRYKTKEYGIKDFKVLVNKKLKPSIQLSPFKTINASVVGEINHESTSYKVVRVDNGATVYTLSKSKQYLTGITLPEPLESGVEYRAEVTYHADNPLVEPKTAFYTFITAAVEIEQPSVELVIAPDRSKAELVSSPFKIINSDETHVSTTWKVYRSTNVYKELVTSTENLTRLDITDILKNYQNNPVDIDIIYHTASYNSEPITIKVALPEYLYSEERPFAIEHIGYNEKGCHKFKIKDFKADLANKTISSVRIHCAPYNPTTTLTESYGYFSGGAYLDITVFNGKNTTDDIAELEYTLTEDNAKRFMNVHPTLSSKAFYRFDITIQGTVYKSDMIIAGYDLSNIKMPRVEIDQTVQDRPVFKFIPPVLSGAEKWMLRDEVDWRIFNSDGRDKFSSSRPQWTDAFSLPDYTKLDPDKFYYVTASVRSNREWSLCSESEITLRDNDNILNNTQGKQFYVDGATIREPFIHILNVEAINDKLLEFKFKLAPFQVITKNNKTYTPLKTKVSLVQMPENITILDYETDYTRDIVIKNKTTTQPNDGINPSTDPLDTYLKANSTRYKLNVSFTCEPQLTPVVKTIEFTSPGYFRKGYVNGFDLNVTENNLDPENFSITATIPNDITIGHRVDQTHTSTEWDLHKIDPTGYSSTQSLYKSKETLTNLKSITLTRDMLSSPVERDFCYVLTCTVNGPDGTRPAITNKLIYIPREDLTSLPRKSNGSYDEIFVDRGFKNKIRALFGWKHGDLPDSVVWSIKGGENVRGQLDKWSHLINDDRNPDIKVSTIHSDQVENGKVLTIEIIKRKNGNSTDHLCLELDNLFSSCYYEISVRASSERVADFHGKVKEAANANKSNVRAYTNATYDEDFDKYNIEFTGGFLTNRTQYNNLSLTTVYATSNFYGWTKLSDKIEMFATIDEPYGYPALEGMTSPIDANVRTSGAITYQDVNSSFGNRPVKGFDRDIYMHLLVNYRGTGGEDYNYDRVRYIKKYKSPVCFFGSTYRFNIKNDINNTFYISSYENGKESIVPAPTSTTYTCYYIEEPVDIRGFEEIAEVQWEYTINNQMAKKQVSYVERAYFNNDYRAMLTFKCPSSLSNAKSSKVDNGQGSGYISFNTIKAKITMKDGGVYTITP